ncbi:isoprenylcysteine carboxylmethyltransferase family protein [Promicromonospora sp. NPDC023987]|uniref:methyltransferase family protein n=1 Tax=Promicromonospora sp. NPDC023987 TaxID=3155360 RepID=UPI0033DA89C1
MPLLGRMARDLDQHGQLRPSTATSLWIAYLTHAGLTVRALRSPDHRLPLPTWPARVAGAASVGVGVAACVSAMRQFSGPSQATGTRIQPLITSGIYRHSRHPQYLGYLTALAGAAVMRRSATALAWSATLAVAYATWVPVEERHLTRLFGRPYLDYADRTHRWWGRGTA